MACSASRRWPQRLQPGRATLDPPQQPPWQSSRRRLHSTVCLGTSASGTMLSTLEALST